LTGNLYFNGQRTDRAVFTERAQRLATYLGSVGVQTDGVVAILMRNDTTYLEVMEACRYVGASYVTLNWHSSKTEIEHILDDSGAQVLIGHADLTAPFGVNISAQTPIIAIQTPEAVLKNYKTDNQRNDGQLDYEQCLADHQPITTPPERFKGIFAYTSGSTGRPKGIKRTTDPDRPDPFMIYAGLARQVLQANAGDKFCVAAPLYHSAPNALSMFCMAAGDVDVYVEAKFDPEAFLADIERYKLTHAYIVPTMMIRMLKLPQAVKNKYDTSSWRYGISTGSPWPADVKTAMIDWFGPIFYESYGASEIGFMTLISSEEALQRPGSVGKVLPGGSIKILDDDRNELAPGDTGGIYVHLPMFGTFAYTNVEGDLEGQKYLDHASVGDVGHLDDDGYLYISDRKKDMIISGGANVFPSEIESVLIEMDEVADCAVFGAPDPEYGERIVAAVQPMPDCTLDIEQMRAFLGTKLAKFKIPRKLDLHEALPREDSGKIFKNRLREPYWAEQKTKI
jgi:long-chain acyl-CoA synthetase